MSSFVITNTGSIPIKIAGVELEGGGACRGCPMEHIDLIEAPEGATYVVKYIEPEPPPLVFPEAVE